MRFDFNHSVEKNNLEHWSNFWQQKRFIMMLYHLQYKVGCLLSVQNLLASSTSRRAAKKKKKKAEKATAEATVEDMDEMTADAEP